MSALKFPLSAVQQLAEHARASKAHAPTPSQHFDRAFWKDAEALLDDQQVIASEGDHLDPSLIPAGLWLVKDQGIYLMSNGMPSLPGEDSDGSVVVYAEGFDPAQDGDWPDEARRAVGGDDFVEFVPLGWVDCCQAEGVTDLCIEVTDDEMRLTI